ncbi:hypothetical protein [Nocardiopsis lambiniae]|uniref:DUF4062 domain-containing protein n=1 Tax=Nocardiopsis lambiniae TaxID=3075539 RepID=A0ABU2ME98_9ACTN|nr:hypothetical protein [Nocardiopsis sp. DSM 44743]MDT0331019.1 hypothetical protein [Nocardiopsis sp. DSM 44743]
MEEKKKIFLFLGSFPQAGLQNKLKLSDVWYATKLPESSPENWHKITQILKSSELIGVVGKFGRSTYRRLASEEYESASKELLSALSKVAHVIFIHEDIINGDDTPYDKIFDYGGNAYAYEDHLAQIPKEQTESANALLKEHGVQVTAYKKNSELHVLADSFIEDLENNLLFRIYIPKGRIYSNEMSRLLELFQEWLTSAKKEKIRRDGYRTSSGQVIEFFSERNFDGDGVSGEIEEFSRFLDICSYPEEASRVLQGIGVDQSTATEMVRRYSKEVRRLRVDIKQEREQRILQIRHRMESEIIDEPITSSIQWHAVGGLIASMIPDQPRDISSVMRHQIFSPNESGGHIQINQQIIERAYGEVTQNIAGTQHFGPDAQALIELIRTHGEAQEIDLIASVHELSDDEARTAERLTAKQKLKSFLLRSRDQIESTAFGIAQSYIESQMGL